MTVDFDYVFHVKEITNIIRGDMLEVVIDYDESNHEPRLLKLLEVNTNKDSGGTDLTRQHGLEAKECIAHLKEQSTDCFIKTIIDPHSKCDCVLAELWLVVDDNAINISEYLKSLHYDVSQILDWRIDKNI